MSASPAAERRRDAARAGHCGDTATARNLVDDGDPSVRATAFAALARCDALTLDDVRAALADESAVVRRRACALAIAFVGIDLVPLLADAAVMVVETAAWALGERGAQSAEAVAALSAMAVGHEDALCREAAVAALGAIGDPSGLPAILHATADKPAIRRRAVLALAPFEGPDVDAALRRASADRDWQTREAAADLLGEDPPPH